MPAFPCRIPLFHQECNLQAMNEDVWSYICTGESAHVEVFDKTGRHLGEANPTTGEIEPGSADPSKTLKVR